MVNVGNTLRAGLASLLIGLSSCSEPKSTEAEKFYQNFPDSAHLEDTRQVVKYETPGAKHCLVHIRQIHYEDPPFSMAEIRADRTLAEDYLSLYPTFSETVGGDEIVRYRNLVRKGLDEVCATQTDIFKTLSFLKSSCQLKSVRSEGATEDYAPKNCFNQLMFRNFQAVKGDFATEDEIKDPKKYLMLGGGDIALGMTGLNIKRAEDAEIYRQVGIKMNNLRRSGRLSKEEVDKINKPREDHVLKLIYEDMENYSVVVFGADHDFRDNIAEWNSKHSDDKFSLIVVTPKSYKK